MNIMLITGAKLTALKVEVPFYKIKWRKAFSEMPVNYLHLGQEKMENS